MFVVPILAVLASSGLAAENLLLTGKPANWETWGEAPKKVPAESVAGETLETPNQARRRLRLPIEASFPAVDYGVYEETPNQLRRRLETGRLAEAR